jgi:alpha/beta superfamily hydrolase
MANRRAAGRRVSSSSMPGWGANRRWTLGMLEFAPHHCDMKPIKQRDEWRADGNDFADANGARSRQPGRGPMPEIIFTGPAGRLEGRFQPAKRKNGPIAIVLHPHPQFGGTMNNQIVYQLFYMFSKRGFAVLRFNFRGVGRSQGEFDHGSGELSDAAAALDWVQSVHPDAKSCWVAGFSFGAWIGMQLLMRRPEIEGFISIAPQPNLYDFTFLAPCPSSGLIIHGENDKVAPPKDVQTLVDKLKTQKGIKIDQKIIKGANHFFESNIDELIEDCAAYLDRRLAMDDAA